MTDDLLTRTAVELSGLSGRQFARSVCRVNERTLRRWMAGEPLSHSQRVFLTNYVASFEPRPTLRKKES